MNIRFTSSLTPDDENRLAPVILQAVSAILNAMPLAYMVRIDTSDSQVYQVSGSGTGAPAALPAQALDRGAAWGYRADLA
jgi:hypothetical protein